MESEDMWQVYLQFVEERHRIWQQRQAGLPAPWTEDVALGTYKYTNVFRVLDYGSQYLLRELLTPDGTRLTYADALMRAFLYRYNNRPEPWEFFHLVHGRYPVQDDLVDVLPETWWQYRNTGGAVFGMAYKMFSGSENKGTDRLTWILNMTRDHFHPESEFYIGSKFAKLSDMKSRLALLQTVPRCAGFMSMQIVTDMGYTVFVRGNEDEHVIPGPGAKVGAEAALPGVDPLDAIYLAQAELHSRPDCPQLPLPGGGYRLPSLMDVQNTFCEFGKYVRYRQANTPGPYRPSHPDNRQEPVLPAHWQYDNKKKV